MWQKCNLQQRNSQCQLVEAMKTPARCNRSAALPIKSQKSNFSAHRTCEAVSQPLAVCLESESRQVALVPGNGLVGTRSEKLLLHDGTVYEWLSIRRNQNTQGAPIPQQVHSGAEGSVGEKKHLNLAVHYKSFTEASVASLEVLQAVLPTKTNHSSHESCCGPQPVACCTRPKDGACGACT